MKTYQILFQNADGQHSWTRDIIAFNPQEAYDRTTDFVRKNFINIYRIDAIQEEIYR